MKIKNILLMCVVLLSLAVLLSQCVRPPSGSGEAVQVGDAAPQFKLPDIRGREFPLDQYKGKVVLLDFWATWCGPCRMTMPLLEKLQNEFHSELVLLAINVQEDADVVRDYIREENLSSQVLLDKEGSVAASYGIQSLPTHILIDGKGTVQFIQLGFNPRMESQFRTEIRKLL